MNWKALALTTQVSLCLCPVALRAQSTEEKPLETLPEAPEPASIGKVPLGDIRIDDSVALGIPHPKTDGIEIVYADLFNNPLSGSPFNTVSDTYLEITSTEFNARVSATISSNATSDQGLVGASGSNAAEASVTFPPGALAISTEISVDEVTDRRAKARNEPQNFVGRWSSSD